MNKVEIIDAIAAKAEINKKDARIALDAFQEVVTDAMVKGEKVALTGFATFETVEVAEKECRNPQDGSKIIVPKHNKVKVKVGKGLKNAVNE